MTHHTDIPPDPANGLAEEGEPLGLFRNLPEIELDACEMADMKRSVHEMIHTRAVEAALDERDGASAPRREGRARRFRRASARVVAAARVASSSVGLRIAAAVGTVTLATALLLPTFAPQPLLVASQPAGAFAPTRAELAEIEALPLVDNLDGDTELIQIEDPEMSLVVAAVR